MSLTEDLKNQQPILYRILEQSFKNNKIPHAFLLVGKNSSSAAHYIAKSLICEDELLACNKCNECHRVDEHNYGDLIYVSGKTESIKKGSIEYIQEQFAKSSMEGKAKIYILEDIENSSVEAMNSLLKILEEPLDGVYAIFTCQNLSRVLPTIQSRCQVIQLLPNSKSLLKADLVKFQIPDDDINILSELFQTTEECSPYVDSDLFEQLKLEVYHFIDDLYFHRDNLVINVETHLLKTYNDKVIIQIFLNMLVLAFRDLFHVKHNIDLTYSAYRDLFERIDDDVDKIVDKIELVLNTEYLLSTNANVMLLMDSMMCRI
ncbi:MAG: hypothetical protein RR630_02315 [Coprobacillus sp.]